ncbi:hypothetical protein B0H13DRAFT_1910762 [Mycena leptocephala]|nr:hypothetical protein B0H13DRAFT_1910762 [Mycena leptocephala]
MEEMNCHAVVLYMPVWRPVFSTHPSLLACASSKSNFYDDMPDLISLEEANEGRIPDLSSRKISGRVACSNFIRSSRIRPPISIDACYKFDRKKLPRADPERGEIFDVEIFKHDSIVALISEYDSSCRRVCVGRVLSPNICGCPDCPMELRAKLTEAEEFLCIKEAEKQHSHRVTRTSSALGANGEEYWAWAVRTVRTSRDQCI